MSNTLIVDPCHFLNKDGMIGDLPKPAERLVTYLGSIVKAVSHSGNNKPVSTAIICQRRPGHKRCTGRIVAGIDARHSYEIDWQCPSCGDNGIVSG